MDQKQFEEMVAGSILEEAMTVDLTQVSSPPDEVENPEAILGVMTELEKCFYALARRKAGEVAAICAGCDSGKSADEKAALCRQRDGAKKQRDASAKLMWGFIEARLGHGGNMALRDGFQIEATGGNGSPDVHVVRVGIGGHGADSLGKVLAKIFS